MLRRQGYHLAGFSATEGMVLGTDFVPVRVGVYQGIHFPDEHPPLGTGTTTRGTILVYGLVMAFVFQYSSSGFSKFSKRVMKYPAKNSKGLNL